MKRAVIAIVALVFVAGLPRLLEAQHNEHSGKFTFTGIATSIGLPGNPTGQAPVAIVVTRWSTDAERQALLTALKEGGQKALLDKLHDVKPVGTIRVNNQGLSYDLFYSHERPDPEGGRQIVLGTDRPISAWEAINQPRSIDYPFTFIQMHLDDKGHGEGTIVLAAKITASDDGRYITVENLAAGPVKLTNIEQH
jgi:hypothetical protein